MRIQAAKRLLTVKMVYYGPGLGGKTTNLACLHERFPSTQRGEMLQLDTDTERTLFFDYFPMVLGRIGGYRVKVDFFTVPGQSFYHATRRAVLEGADGIAFIADSSPSREEANVVSREDLVANLAALGKNLDDIPHVYQWNKRDARNALPVGVMAAILNPEGAPSAPAIAIRNRGVWETHRLLLGKVFDKLRESTGVSTKPAEARVG